MGNKCLILIVLCISLLSGANIYAQLAPKEIEAKRLDHVPDIDGRIDEKAWQSAVSVSDFYQYDPHNDRPASFQTHVKLLFDDNALYVGARMEDPEPAKILSEMGLRDANDNINADQFWIDINPFNDGINGFRFKVSASGVQTDINLSTTGDTDGDLNWDAVWESEVSTDSLGWTVEMKIPYAALRFPGGKEKLWGINFWREIRRTREQSSWNPADRKVNNPIAFMGIVKGIQGIEPPLRLAFFPYVSGYLENYKGAWGRSAIAGMDVKLGISNSFTMDMTLIPDFGQVQSDERILNLSPYEVKYDEKRQFFTEGTELFSKADIFYSRRIGSKPKGYDHVEEGLRENEVVKENPLETRMVNATKLSGRTSGGLGLGVFNAMTMPSKAIISDTITGINREVLSQPFTNYNIVVVDQTLKNNSYISLINTNVSGAASNYMANVTGTEFRIKDKSKMFNVSGTAALSQQYQSTGDVFGHSYEISAGKDGGTWQYEYEHEEYSHTYDPNDLGYLAHNNYQEDELSFSYNLFKPYWRIWNLQSEAFVSYNRLQHPNTFTGINWGYNMNVLFDTRFFVLFNSSFSPMGFKDFFEPRVKGRYYKTGKTADLYLYFSTDYRKRVYFDGNLSYKRIEGKPTQLFYGLELIPTIRINNRMSISYGFNYSGTKDETGFGSVLNSGDIMFAERQNKVLINSIKASYIFTNDLSLNFNLRHYWSVVRYSGIYFLLNADGSLSPLSDVEPLENINYNAFTIDMMFTWNFAPGSQLSLAWKNSIDGSDQQTSINYWRNLNHTLELPQLNSLSLKVLYYIDYPMMAKVFSHKKQ